MKKTKRTVIILYAISVVVFLAYWGLYWLSRRLETFDGFYTNYPTPIGWAPEFILFTAVLPYSLLMLACGKSENKRALQGVFGVFILFMGIMFGKTLPQVYRHYNHSIMLKDTRYDITDIELEDVEKISRANGNYILYIGRPSCLNCDFAYDKIYKSTEREALMVYYYDTSKDREDNNREMTAVLDKYSINSVPAVIFFVDGKVDKCITGNEVVKDFSDIVHQYKTNATYFTDKLK